MKFLWSFALLVFGLSNFSAPNANAETPTILFDGTSLTGWDGDSKHWRVEDGAIVGEIPPGQQLRKNTWLVWTGGELADFDLKLQVKLTGAAAANSGIQYRCQVENYDHVSGYQADCDMGTTWLGRIYDEHGRALLVERGARVLIEPDGTRHSESFAPADQFAVLFRENAWNDYRIVGIGDHVAVYVNGTLFSELRDQQANLKDLTGKLAFQLHSGPETRVEFRNITLETLKSDDTRLKPFEFKQKTAPERVRENPGLVPTDANGQALNMGFESGTLAGWTATGDAFKDQPVKQDGISSRWAGQTSNKSGDYFIGGFEIVRDAGTGTLTSPTFPVSHRYASFLIGGGDTPSTRVEIFQPGSGDEPEKVLFSATGEQREQMRRVAADLDDYKGQQVAVRVIDENPGAWGHLNFDDFRWHDEPPAVVESSAAWRSTQNPILQHLVPNLVISDKARRGTETVSQMFVPAGFSVEVIAAEPQLHQPMAFTFDTQGRLWVVEGHSYPKKRPEGEGLDRVLIFSDEDGDGEFETRKVFAEGLNLVSGLEVGHGGVWIGAAPELLFIPDRDVDDVPDSEPVVLLDGFGFADTHETINSFMWGPDGWLYGNQGVFNNSWIGPPGSHANNRQALKAGVWRYHPIRHQFEVFAHGGSNQWGLDYDEHGQIFMTHCRSYWGRGSTTHVIQGGHFWNQVNGGYAPYISNTPLPDRPWMQNYMLASARYGHGEGGAGKKGSRAVYGGHSHVGTMIYLGDNWPAEYRNHLFSHNLHGHQMNQQVNVREHGGYNTMHAGEDVLFCADQQYIGVELKYGPDGAVYISDWYDPRHCHNPNVELWDRGNGRLYRMKYDATYQSVSVDYAHATEQELVEAQLHPNDWHVRAARLVLSERAAEGTLSEGTIEQLRILALEHEDSTRRLRGLWALHAVNAVDVPVIQQILSDQSEYVRAWAIQLAVEVLEPNSIAELLREQTATDNSLFVRRYIASAIQRLPSDLGWDLAETLSKQPENGTDRELPQLLWIAVAQFMDANQERALKMAATTPLVSLRDAIHWYAAKLSDEGRTEIAQLLKDAQGEEQLRLLSLFELGVRGMRGLPEPAAWAAISTSLYDSEDNRIRGAAESLGAAFGDNELYARMRTVLSDPTATAGNKRHALSTLAADTANENLRIYLTLLDDKQFIEQVIPMLGQYDDDAVAETLLSRLPELTGNTNAAAMQVLTSRPQWAHRVLDAINSNSIEKSLLTAYFARQMSGLGDLSLNARLKEDWGSFSQSSEEIQHEINKMVAEFNSAPLWAYSEQAGAAQFKKVCATCHLPNGQDERLGPNLAGTGSKGIGYIVENIMDPNAVIGRDFQARIIVTSDGRVLTGLIQDESDTAITLRMATNTVTIAKEEIDAIKVSENSFMPVGLLKTLNDRERIELLKFLMTQ